MALLSRKFRGDPKVYETLQSLSIPFQYVAHPPVATVKEASKFWVGIDAAHCKNLFFRNHKGNQHFLVIYHYMQSLNIQWLKQNLRQGKLSLASSERMMHYLGLEPGAVSPFGLLHDSGRHVVVFIDSNLQNNDRISFHPNINTASLVIKFADFIRFLHHTGHSYQFVTLCH